MVALKDLPDDHPALMQAPLIRSITLLTGWNRANGPIPLTQGKAFKRVFVDWAARNFDWPGHSADDLYAVNKVLNEHDMLPLMVIHDLLIAMRLGRHYKGSFHLTKAGGDLAGRPGAIFEKVLPFWLTRYDHAALSRFEEDDILPDWGICLNILNVEAESGVTGARLRDVFCTKIDAQGHMVTHDGMHALWLQVLRPLVWCGLLHQIDTAHWYRTEEATFMKTALWQAALVLETDRMVTRPTWH